MQTLEARVRTLVLRGSSQGSNLELPSTVLATTIAEADAVVLSGDACWASSTIQTIRSLGIRLPILVVRAKGPSTNWANHPISGADICVRADANDAERAAGVRVLQTLVRKNEAALNRESSKPPL